MEIAVVLVIALGAVAAVIVPLLKGGGAHDPELDPDTPIANRRRDPADTERVIEEYRRALRQGTVCRRCGRANPEESRFCAECGRRIRAAKPAAKVES